MRSNDLFRGLPYNLIQFTALQEIMAGWLEVRMGSYHHLSDSLHVYDEEVPVVMASHLEETEENIDSLCLPKADFEPAFAELLSAADRIIDQSSTAEQLAQTAMNAALPQSYRNILFVLCAEGARRRRDASIMEAMISACTNGAYRQLYRRWLLRLQQT